MIRVIDLKEKKEFLDEILKRSQLEFREVNEAVDEILEDVRKDRDEALIKYTLKFDGVIIDNFEVTKAEMKNALYRIEPELKEALLFSKSNIEEYHRKQLKSSSMSYKGEDIILGELIKPIDRVGIYVPGGRAAYPSTVLMNAVPAKIAGVKEVIMITPPDKDGKIKDAVLAAAYIAGVDRIFKVGGAQGIGALAYGTQSIPKVFKIVGPGNIYVSMAKKKVAGYVGIDMIAGPSEILILADEWANPSYIAADMISQAEHDEMASSILVTDSPNLGIRVKKELERQIENLERKDIIKKSLRDNGVIILTNSLCESLSICNDIAPEHLEILTKNPFDTYKQINNAGAIFLGEYSPVPLGDYYAGPNHTLPTSLTSRFSSPLGVDDFLKKTSLIYYSKEALREAKDKIIKISREEGLTAHSNSIEIRFRGDEAWSL